MATGEYESARDALRARLQAANVLMRYDYAWKEIEFERADSRLTGVACRLLYQFALWRLARLRLRAALAQADAAIAVAVEANGFDAFREQVAAAALRMGCRVLPATELLAADLVFVYVAPPGEARVEGSQFGAFQRVADSAASTDELPMFCFLLGEADFLEPPQDDETERLRGLSEFAIAQQLQPCVAAAGYGAVAQVAVEFTPGATPAADQDAKQHKLEQLMADFGCVDHNLMHFTEKWEFYAPAQSALVRDAEALAHPEDDEALYWLECAKDRTCHCCHKAAEKLAWCARCHNVRYCSRECQRADWQMHKRLCGKTPEEISSA
ncbi:hypothetical protein PybrP1_004631 [[Pythium] brassicae (nom. inval.)]|nr:hypothetical protein PybrP1_004631 [[Pythium] brassicae (nom. inval.)]